MLCSRQPRSRSRKTRTHAIKVPPIASPLPAACFLLGFPRALFTRTASWVGLYGGAGGPARNPTESDPVWGTGTALAGGTAQGSTFPRDVTKAVCVSRAQLCSPLPQPRVNPLCQSLGATPPGGGEHIKERGSAHLAPQTPALPAPTAGCFLFFFSFLILKTNILLTPPSALPLCISDLHQPSASPFSSDYFLFLPTPRSPI